MELQNRVDSRRIGGARQAESREGSEFEVRATWARCDEWGSERKDCLGAEGGIKALRHGLLLAKDANGTLVTSLDGENRASNTKNSRGCQQGGSSKVGRDTDVLKNGGSCDHAGGISEAKVVSARRDGLDVVLRERGLENNNVLRLGEANLRQILDLSVAETESSKIRGREFGEALLIESIFEILQGQGAVKKC